MTGAAHTPTPWSASEPDGSYHDVIRIFADADPTGALPVAICPQRKSPAMAVLSGEANTTTEAAFNAARIVACVNALEGIPDPSVVGEAIEALRSNTNELERIAHTKATDFRLVRELIVSNRATLAKLDGSAS